MIFDGCVFDEAVFDAVPCSTPPVTTTHGGPKRVTRPSAMQILPVEDFRDDDDATILLM